MYCPILPKAVEKHLKMILLKMVKDRAQHMKRDVLTSESIVLTTTANSTMDTDDMDGDGPT